MEEISRKPGRKALLGDAVHQEEERAEYTARSRKSDEFETTQARKLLEALEALRKGDLTVRLRKETEDIFGELADSYNQTVDNLNVFASEVTRVAKEVGLEGTLGGQAEVPGVAGTWKDLTDNVNMLAENLTNQVRNIADVTTAIAEGDLSKKITVDVKGEILELKNTINGMVDNLNAIIGDIITVMAGVSEGDLSEQIEVEAMGRFEEMVKNINNAIDDLGLIVGRTKNSSEKTAEIAKEYSASSQQLNSSATEIASSIAEISKGAAAQSEKVTESLKTMEGIASSGEKISARAKEAGDSSEKVVQTAGEAAKEVDEALKTMIKVSTSSIDSTKSVRELSEKSQRISEFVSVITNIASQTNLLSLNAAIEAARAGEAGRGFAVVADEVRKLAEDSEKSAGEISSLVTDILSGAEGAVSSSERAGKEVDQGKILVEKFGQTFKEIVTSIESINAMINQISEGTAQQTKGNESVVNVLEGLAATSEETASGAEEVAASTEEQTASIEEMAASAQELETTAISLTDLVARFKLAREREDETSMQKGKKNKTEVIKNA